MSSKRIVLILTAAVLVAVGSRPLRGWEMLAVTLCCAFGGWLAVLPFLKEQDAAVKLAETDGLAETAARLSKGIRSYITKRFPEDGEVVFTRLEAGIIAHGRDPKVIEALLELVREPELKRTARWVQDLLPRLYSQPAQPAPE